MSRQLSLRSLLRGMLFMLILALPLLASSRAEAKFFLVTSGNSIADISELPPEVQNKMEEPGWRFGYYYNYFGLFWLDAWTWGGEFCLYKGNKYQKISREDAKNIIPANLVSEPFFYSYPSLLLLLLLLLLIIFSIAALEFLGSLVKPKQTMQNIDASTTTSRKPDPE